MTTTTDTLPAPPEAANGAPRPQLRKPGSGWMFGGALGAFFAVIALMALQVRAGQDPALGPAEPVGQAPPTKPRQVLVRRVIRRVVVHHPPRQAAAAGGAAPAAGAPVAASSSAPAAAAPAPEPAAAPPPAPAPAPAPLTTQAS